MLGGPQRDREDSRLVAGAGDLHQCKSVGISSALTDMSGGSRVLGPAQGSQKQCSPSRGEPIWGLEQQQLLECWRE